MSAYELQLQETTCRYESGMREIEDFITSCCL